MNEYYLAEELVRDYILVYGYEKVFTDNYYTFLDCFERNEPVTMRSEITYDEDNTTLLQEVGEYVWVLLIMLYGNYVNDPKFGWIENTEGFLNFIKSLENS